MCFFVLTMKVDEYQCPHLEKVVARLRPSSLLSYNVMKYITGLILQDGFMHF